MKRTILYLSLLMFIMQGYSQGLELYFEGIALAHNAEISLTGHPDSGMMVLDTLDVKNISATTMEVKCIRTIIENVDSTFNSFCWGVCYPPSIDTSSISVTISSQATSYEFTGDHNPAGKTGKVKVKYSFYDIHTPESQSSVFVNYDHTSIGDVGENPGNLYVSGAYPNPANNLVSLDYDLTGSRNAKILIYNLLGTILEEIDIADSTGKITLNTSGYNEGLYFYSLKVNNEIIKTRKLVIRHN